jgi:hypothetical protein
MRASARTLASRPFAGRRLLVHLSLLSLFIASFASSGCSLRTYAINMVGDALASGDSVYETDDDIELCLGLGAVARASGWTRGRVG